MTTRKCSPGYAFLTPALSRSSGNGISVPSVEASLAAKQRAALLREALLTLDDRELTVVMVHFSGATARETGLHIGSSHVTVLRYERRALLKLRHWFADRGVLEVSDIL